MPDDEPTVNESGITGSIKHLLESISEFLTTKLDLIGVEVQEEKRRVLELLVLAAAVLLFGVLSLTVLTFTIVVLLWDTHRIAALMSLSLTYLSICAILAARLKRKTCLTTKIFDTTVEELKKDREWVKRHL